MRKIAVILAMLAFQAQAGTVLELEADHVKSAMQIQIGTCWLARHNHGSDSEEFKSCVKTGQSRFKELYAAFSPKLKKASPEARAALKTMFIKAQMGLLGLNVQGSETKRAYDARQAELEAALEEAHAALQLEL